MGLPPFPLIASGMIFVVMNGVGRLSHWSLFIFSCCFVPSARSDGMQKLPHDCDSETYQLSPRLSEITRLIEDQKPHQQKIDPDAPGGSSRPLATEYVPAS